MKITFLKISIATIALSGLTFIGCQKDQVTKTSSTLDSSRVTTEYNASLNLSGYSTIAVSDSVMAAGDSTGTFELAGSEATYVKAFKDSLAARGFSVVSVSAHPDLVLNITKISATTSGAIDNASYWNHYASFYHASVYGDSTATYNNTFTGNNPVTTGVLSFELLDLKDVSLLNQISIIWNGQVSGKATYEDDNLVNQVVGLLLQKSPLSHNP